MKRYINIIAIDNNSPELHNKLRELGYKPLSWTTSTGKNNLRTVLTNSYPYDKDYRLSFWNDGSSSDKFKNSSSALFCNTIDEFIEKSIYLLNNNDIIIEEN